MESRYYVVKKDDTLWGIARHFGISVEALAARNGLFGKRANHIAIGQKLYLPDADANSPDLRLSVRVTGLSGKPIKRAKIKITHDGKTTETRADQDGWLHGLHISDHTQGLKVEFECGPQWRTIFDEETLPLGDKVLYVNTLTELTDGRTVCQEGPTLLPKKNIGTEIRKQTPQPDTTGSPKNPLPHVPADPVVMDTRTDNGAPVTIVAPVFASENLLLPKPNEKFRQALIDSAKRYGFTPHALAAIVDAEAARKKNNPAAWEEDSACGGSSARGLGQFLPAAWYQYVAKPGTLGNAEAIKLLGAAKLYAEYGKLYNIDGGKKAEVNALRLNTILSWRDHGGYAIDAIASYAEDNLTLLKSKGIDATSLPPDEKAKIAYIMHHEGPHDGVLFFQSLLGKTEASTPKTVKGKLARQFKTKKSDGIVEAKALADKFGGDYIKAYYYFLANHTDIKIRAKNFMLKHDGFTERSAYAVIEQISGLHIEKPSTQSANTTKSSGTIKELSIPVEDEEVSKIQHAGSVDTWSDPLEHCSIRIGGYCDSKTNPNSARNKSLFGGRGGKHTGIDLCAVPGTPVKAVANGVVHFSGKAGTYGNVIVIAININDLPEKKKQYAKGIPEIENDTIYFMYAHLSRIDVAHRPPEFIRAGQIIGKTGDTGNAHGMTEIGPYSEQKFGAHLHFEVRRSSSLTKGKGKWFDPKPFLTYCE